MKENTMNIQTMKIRFIPVIMLLVSLLLFSASVFAQSADTLRITVRIEGIADNLFYQTENIPHSGSLSVKEALEHIDDKYDNLEISGLAENFITAVNGESSGFFGGWDGWLYRVNNTDAAVGIHEYQLQEGDTVLLYYGDPFGVGMQFPEVDDSRIGQGILKFTSNDTTYDAEYNSTTTVNPVVSATIFWYTGDTSVIYTTDAQGEIRIDQNNLTEGPHRIQAEKTAGDTLKDGLYLPLLLRFPPDATVRVQPLQSSPPSGDGNGMIYWVPLFLLAVLLSGVLIMSMKRRMVLEREGK
jgi:hypothetical protein